MLTYPFKAKKRWQWLPLLTSYHQYYKPDTFLCQICRVSLWIEDQSVCWHKEQQSIILLLSKSVSHLKQNQDFKKFWNSESVLQRPKLNLNHNITYIFFPFLYLQRSNKWSVSSRVQVEGGASWRYNCKKINLSVNVIPKITMSAIPGSLLSEEARQWTYYWYFFNSARLSQ